MEDNSKNKLIATMCLLATIITALCSMAYTSLLFASMGDGVFASIPVLMGICSDFGKYGFSAASAYAFNRNKYISSILFAMVALGCVVVSFAASQAYDLNQKNKIKNEAITENGAYQRTEKIFDTNAKSVEESQKELSNLTTNKEKIIAESVKSLEEQRNLLPNNYITKRAELQTKIEEIKQNKTNEINTRIAQLEKIINDSKDSVKKINNDFKTLESKVETTEGVYALAKWLNPKNPEKFLGNMTMAKNIFLEIISISFSLAFGLFLGKSNFNLKFKAKKIDLSKIKQKLPIKQELQSANQAQMEESQVKEIEDEEKKTLLTE